MKFEDFKLNKDLLAGLDSMGFSEATPVQDRAIPVILEGRDLIACAQTGTGKTAAFILPLIHKIRTENNSGLSTLVIAPTRELAQQIDQQIQGLGYFASISSIPVFGGGDGVSWAVQKRSLVSGVNIVVATPGRLIAMLGSSGVDFSSVKYLVLDEADRMLDMGFFDDIMRIISYLPEKRQTLLFSATMPPRIEQMASKILKKPFRINLSLSKPAEGIIQQAFVLYEEQKEKMLFHILQDPDFESVLVFASTRVKVKQISELLRSRSLDVKAFHSDLEQTERQEIIRLFKNRKLRIIVATDVLSRGIDVDNISLVINFDAPGDPEDYVHRVGRTARAAKTGKAITFIGEKEQGKFAQVEKLIGYQVEKSSVPEKLGKTPEYLPERRKPHNKKKNSFKRKKRKGAKPGRKN
ncbi:MAG: DEAD/DEAH box helicase [Bacteroidota bacterium]